MSAARPRVAFLGMHLEANAFAPPTLGADFRRRCWFEGAGLMEEARAKAPLLPAEVPGFLAEMDKGEWEPLPLIVTAAEPGGPAEHDFFAQTVAEMAARLKAARPDAVYITNHGAMTTDRESDADGVMWASLRAAVGPGVPVAATVDFHANVSQLMVDSVDALIGYRTNPHVDMAARAADAARVLRRMLAGARTAKAFIRLPIVAPSVTQLTASGPMAELVKLCEAETRGAVLNVTVLGGFAFGDTPKNGLAIVATAEGSDPSPARRAALRVAEAAWALRQRFRPTLTPLADAVGMAKAVGLDPSRAPLIFADVADNPGGGGRGNTVHILRAFKESSVRGAVLGLFIDPALAAEAHAKGKGAEFEAAFNRAGETEYSKRFAARSRVLALHDGRCVGRRGIFAGRSVELGRMAALDIGGIVVALATQRVQCCDPAFLEALGIDPGKARSVVVKSRGHFRAGFDLWFAPDRVIEVDCPGLTSPVLSRFSFKHLPRPAIPLDADAEWQRPAW